jgi:hypothetical protein
MIIRGHAVSNEMAAKIADTLDSLNANWGRGDVREVTFLSTTDDGKRMRGVVTRRIPTTQTTGFEEERVFHVVGSTVFFLKHQHKMNVLNAIVENLLTQRV